MSDHINDLIPGFAGRAVTPADAGDDSVRAIRNGAIDHRPAVVAQSEL